MAKTWPGAVLQCQARPARRVERGFRPRQVAREPQQHDRECQRAPDRRDDGLAAAGGSGAGGAAPATGRSGARARSGGTALVRGRGGGRAASGARVDTGSAAVRGEALADDPHGLRRVASATRRGMR